MSLCAGEGSDAVQGGVAVTCWRGSCPVGNVDLHGHQPRSCLTGSADKHKNQPGSHGIDDAGRQSALRKRAAHIVTTPHSAEAPQGRPRGRPGASDANLSPTPRPGNAPFLENGSFSGLLACGRATSMRPRESVGKAEGLDEDDAGEVRSEGSGPQSWALAHKPAAPRSGLRTNCAT